MDYELRIDSNGTIWAHSINRKGRVLDSCSRRSQEQADEMVSSGEARWQSAATAPKRTTSHLSESETRESYEADIREKADRGVRLSPKDWDAAMNRDD